jgi:ribokinase
VADAAPAGDVVLAQLEIPVEAVIAAFTAARQRGATTILNPAPATELPTALLAVTDVIVPNEHEIVLVGGVGALLDAGVSTVIVTMGAAGVEVTTATDPATNTGSGTGTSTAVRHPAVPVEAIDTTGAGDAFCGSLAARLAAGDALDDAVRWAVRAGGLATTRRGAVPSLPTRSEIIAFAAG